MADTPPRGRRLPFAFSELDPAVGRAPVWLEASDTGQSFGILYTPPGRRARQAVYLMHPRGEFARHYVVPGLTARGYAVFGHNSRYLNNDTDMVHERLLFDIAAGMRFLRERGVRAHCPARKQRRRLAARLLPVAGVASRRTERLTHTPGGEPIDLTAEVMPEGDVYIAVAAHLGEGRFMLNVIDPAVTDEDDPLKTDPAWDMYNPSNGYRPWPEPSSYDADWLAGYRAAAARAHGAARRHRADGHRRAAGVAHAAAVRRVRRPIARGRRSR